MQITGQTALVTGGGSGLGAAVAAASAAINQALKDKALVEGLGTVGLVAMGSTPEEQMRSQRAEFERWGPLVKRIGFTAES